MRIIKKDDYQVTVRTSDFRGDHDTDIDVALNIEPDTTIAELVKMVFLSADIRSFDKQADVIRIKFAINKTT